MSEETDRRKRLAFIKKHSPKKYANAKARGWFYHSHEHRLAAKGVKTALAQEQKRARWLVTKPTGEKAIIQLARAEPSDVDRIAKLSNKELLSQFEDSDYMQHVEGQTSVMGAQLYDLLEREINKRGLEDRAEMIVAKNERKAEREEDYV